MKLKVIVHVRRSRRSTERDILHDLLQRYRLDYTAVLEFTLACWEVLEDEDDEGLRVAIEELLTREPRIVRRMERQQWDYAMFQELVNDVIKAVQEFHEGLHPVLRPIIAARLGSLEAEYRLARYFGSDNAALVEVAPRLPDRLPEPVALERIDPRYHRLLPELRDVLELK